MIPADVSEIVSGGAEGADKLAEQFAKEQSIDMLKNYLEGQAKALGQHVNDQQLRLFSRTMIEDVQNYQKRIA